MTPDQERAFKLAYDVEVETALTGKPLTHLVAAEILRAEARGIREGAWAGFPEVIADGREAQARGTGASEVNPGTPEEIRRKPLAALFVLPNGPYAGLPDVEIWDQSRDARTYRGPWRVVAHPPCERWGRYWHGGPSARVRRIKGDDNGCFEAALRAVRTFGGVLEHPAASSAWDAFGLASPPRAGGWINADFEGGWTCCVDQGHYGHRAQKATWLYACGVPLPSLRWGKSSNKIRLDDGYHSAEERRRATKTGVCQRLSKRQRLDTPIPFRDLLLEIAAA